MQEEEARGAKNEDAPNTTSQSDNSNATQDETLTQLLSQSGATWSPVSDFETPLSKRGPLLDEQGE